MDTTHTTTPVESTNLRVESPITYISFAAANVRVTELRTKLGVWPGILTTSCGFRLSYDPADLIFGV